MTGPIYLSRLLTDRAMAHIRTLGAPLRVGGESPPGRAELETGIAGALAAVVTLTELVDADLLAAAGPQLKIVANVAVGYDNIDVDAAAAAGVTVTNTPGVLDRATADHTFAMVLAATRRITEGDRLIRSRQPWVWGPRMLVGLDVSAGATLGILGYGRIGRAVARRAQAFDMTVLATSRSREPGTTEDGVTFVDSSTLLAIIDVVTVLTPLTSETHHLIDAAALAAMKPTAYLINTARGGVVTRPHSLTRCTPAKSVAQRRRVRERTGCQSRAARRAECRPHAAYCQCRRGDTRRDGHPRHRQRSGRSRRQPTTDSSALMTGLELVVVAGRRR
jgi:phosphoglycerate dehydrogenase-like enzyme